jgi:hypothetical protein
MRTNGAGSAWSAFVQGIKMAGDAGLFGAAAQTHTLASLGGGSVATGGGGMAAGVRALILRAGGWQILAMAIALAWIRQRRLGP